MKVVHLNANDTRGGASIACLSISKALNNDGVKSTVLVQKKYFANSESTQVSHIFLSRILYSIRFMLDYVSILILTIKKRGRFSFPYFGIDLSKHKLVKDADIIHLHWINGGFISLKTLDMLSKLNKPIVWTFHDMWPFTGGCHYSGDCTNYINTCKNCPCLKSPGDSDLSNKIFNDKKRLYANFKFHAVTCSNWLALEVERSSLLKDNPVIAIPNPIDVDVFKPYTKLSSRRKYNLPLEKTLILFGTMTLGEERKGFKYLREALRLLYENHYEFRNTVELIIFGASTKKELEKIPFKTNSLGRITNREMLAICYSSADFFVAPSTQDNLPNTVMESLSCGTPVAAFNIGGMPDMIDHKENGFLAQNVNVHSLSEAMKWLIENTEKKGETLRKNAREKVLQNFTSLQIANEYKQLYQKLLEAKMIV